MVEEMTRKRKKRRKRKTRRHTAGNNLEAKVVGSDMKGRIKTYLPKKKYGFIIGEDGRDYFFHTDYFAHQNQVPKIRDKGMVVFTQTATPKGYQARKCFLVFPSEKNSKQAKPRQRYYIVPNKFFISKSNDTNAWDIIHNIGIVSSSSSDSPDGARRSLFSEAQRRGGNALINYRYYKTTEASGNYQYTIHNCRGTVLILARPDQNGKLLWEDLFAQVHKWRKECKRRNKEELSTFLMIVLIIIILVIYGYS